MKLIVTVCLNPKCVWMSLPWPFSVWDGHERDRCPLCGERTFITADAALIAHWRRISELQHGILQRA